MAARNADKIAVCSDAGCPIHCTMYAVLKINLHPAGYSSTLVITTAQRCMWEEKIDCGQHS